MKSIDNETFVSRVPKRLGAAQLSGSLDGVVIAKSARSIRQEVIDEEIKKQQPDDKIIDFVIGPAESVSQKKRTQKKPKVVLDENSLGALKKRHAFSWGRLARGVGIAVLVVGVIGIIAASVLAAVLIDYYNKAPSISDELLKPGESSIVYLSDGTTELFRYGGNQNREVVKLEQVPKQMQWAVIALEQKDFYKEDLPLKSLLRAISDCATKVATSFSTKGKCDSGASGLAQQLYRNVTNDKSEDIQRKLRELFAAYKLLQNNSKDRILELYLNWVSYGSTINGVQVAAKEYFGKDIKDVTVEQACLIAAMPQSPGDYTQGIVARKNPDSVNFKKWERLEDRKNTCLENLFNFDISGNGEKVIKTQAELDTAKKADLAFVENKKDRKYPHWQDYIKSELSKIFENEEDLNKGGLKIVTTIDPRIQEGLDAIMVDECPRINDKYINANTEIDSNAATVVLDGPTGNIVGMVGSCDYYDTTRAGQVNAVTSEGGLSPGSTFKPYDYVTALSKGFNPSTVLINKVTDFGGYKPKNFGNFGAGGLVTFAYGLQNSLNIPALKAAVFAAGEGLGDTSIGMREVVKTSEAMGVRYKDNPDPTAEDHCRSFLSTAIGACQIQMLSHATGFNTLSQDGNLRTATPFISITSSTKDREKYVVDADNARYKAKLEEVYPKKDAAIDVLAARMLNTIITDNSLRNFGQTEKGLWIPGWLGKIAGKTGTSTAGDNNQVKNVWAAGYTKKYTAVVWVGDMKGKTVVRDTAGNIGGEGVAMPVWNRIMRFLHEGIDPEDPSNTFSTEGLIKGNALCPPGTFGGARCANEWMSPDAQSKLNNYKALAAKPDFDVFKSTIFEFRNEAIAFTKLVNKIDGKIIKKDTFPPELVEEKNCGVVPSAFPLIPAWRSTGSAQDPGCTEDSPIDPTKLAIGVSAIPTLASDAAISPQITVKGESQVPGVTFPKVELRVDGVVIASGENTVTFTPNGSGIQGKKTVVLAATDQFGRSIEQTYANVEFNFGPKPFAETDIAAVSSVACFPSNAFTHGVPGYSCTFAFPADKKQPEGGVFMAVANSAGSPCTPNGATMTCLLNIPLNAPLGLQFIKLRIGSGNYVNTLQEVPIN
jgi:membrane peptidoglycan carboxypeptidase